MTTLIVIGLFVVLFLRGFFSSHDIKPWKEDPSRA